MFRTNDRRALARNAYRRRLFRPMVRALEGRVTPTTFTVLNNADAGVGSLRQAIMDTNAAPGFDVIQFALPAGSQTITLQSALPVIIDDIEITGPGAADLTVRRDPSASTDFAVFSIYDGTNDSFAYINNLTISGGRSTSHGGGINALGNSLHVSRVVFQDNDAIGDGGAISLAQGSLFVNRCTFSFNLSHANGGAIAVHNGFTTNLELSTFVHNVGGTGGGGAVAFLGTYGIISIEHSTISQNIAPGLKGSGGIYSDAPVTVTLSETIVSGNVDEFGFPGDVLTPGIVNAHGSALGVTTGIATFNDQGGNLIGADLKLGSLGYHGSSALVIPLGPGSKAIDAGFSTAVSSDQREFARPEGKAYDIGAYEAQVPTMLINNVVLPDVMTASGTIYSFAVRYQDRDLDVGGLDLNSLDDNDVQVTGPNGFDVSAHFVKSTTVGIVTTATYEFTPPGGSWDGADNGTYSVLPNQNQVSDTTGFAVKPPITLGTFQVDTNYIVTNVNDGPVTKAGDLPGSLRQAIFDANAFAGADTIVFNSFFDVPRTITLTSGELNISDPVTVNGPGQQLLTISGNNANRVFFVRKNSPTAIDVVLSQMFLTGGLGALRGGAIGTEGENLTLASCTVSGNKSENGGGIYAFHGSLTLTDCLVTNNDAKGGGGGIRMLGGSLTLTGCTISDNSAGTVNLGEGGGLSFITFNSDTYHLIAIESSTFANNHVLGNGYGGGIFLSLFDPGSAVFRNCTVSGNTARIGGAVELSEGPGYVTSFQNCTIAGNSALEHGGGLDSFSGAAILESTIVADNTATLFPSNGDFKISNLSAKNCGLTTTSGITTFQNLGGNIIGGPFQLQELANTGGPTLTIALGEGSALINKGSNPANLLADQRGDARTSDGVTDIGAFEAIRPTAKATNAFANVSTKGGTSYTLSVTFEDIDTGIDAITIDDGDEIRITGPDGFDVLATFKTFDVNTGIASYQFTPPGGTWTAIDSGTYIVSIEAGQVLDTTALGVAAGALGTFQVTIPDTTVPTAQLTFNDVPTPGATLHTLQVKYSDDVRIKVSTIDSFDVRVQGGPSGFDILATFQSVDLTTDGSPRVATYTFAAPGGQWDGFDLGTYTVSMVGSQVMDTAGLAVNAVTLGTFAFDLLNTVVWDGGPTGNGTDWHIASNWNHDKLPVSTDDVFINTAKTVALNASATIKSLNCATSLTHVGGTLTISAASYVNGAWVLNSNCTLSGAGDLTLAGNSTWSGGDVTGTGKLRIAAGATLAITTNGFRQYARPVENSGTVVWSGANRVDTGAGASWTNLAGSSFDAQANQTWGGNFTPFTNQPNSTFKRSMGSGAAIFGEAFNHQAGPITISSGILQLVAGGIWPNDVTFTGDLHLTRGTFALQKVSGERLTVANSQNPGATVTASLEVTELIHTGSTLNISGTSSAGKWTMIGGTLSGASDLTVSGDSMWSGGDIMGTGKLRIVAGATLAITTNAARQFGRPIENSGEVVWSGANRVDTSAGGSWTNLAGSSFDAQANQDWGSFAAPFTNQAGSTFKRSTGAGSARFNEAFHHLSGPIVISSGVLQLNGGGIWPNDVTFTGELHLTRGTFTLQKVSGDRLTIASSQFPGGTVTASLEVTELIHTGSTLNISGTSSAGKWTMSGGELQGSGDLTVAGASTWSTGYLLGSGKLMIAQGAKLAVISEGTHSYARPIENNGDVVWTGPQVVNTTAGGSWTNRVGSSFDAQSNQDWGNFAAPFTNQPGSTFKRSMGAGTARINESFHHQSGPIEISSGILQLNGGGIWPNDVTFTGDLRLLHGTFSLQKLSGDLLTVGTFFGNLVSVTGSLQVAELIHDNGTLNINATSAVDKWTMTAGTLDGAGEFTVTGQATWSGGTQKGSGTTIISKNVNLHINTASIHVALESRTWSNHGMVTWTGGNAIIAGYGGSWTNHSGSSFDVQSHSGGAYYSDGALTSFIVGVGATFKKSVATGTTLFQMPFTNNGVVQIDTGTLHLSVGLTNYTGSTLAGGSFLVSGTLQYSGGDVITNAAAITLNGPAASIQKSDGSNALSNLATNTMAGHLTLQNGSELTVINTFTNQGIVGIGIGSQLATAAGDYVQSAGTTTVAGTLDPFGSFLLQGGTLNSTGTILAPIVNTGGTISPGNSPGILTVSGDYAQSGTAALNIELKGIALGSQHDQLALNGIVALGGSLLVTLGYTPQVGDSFIAVSNDGTDTISGNFTGLSEGAFIDLPTGRLQITYHGGSDNNDVVLTAVPPLVVPAKVSSTTINDGSAQRSRVTSIQIAFDTLVTFIGSPESAFTLNRQPDNALVVLNAAVDNTGPGTLVTLTFTGGAVNFGSLADGRYTLTALADQFTSGLDGDGNGVIGDNYVLASSVAPNPPINIFRLFGDANGDGTVAANDFIQFRLALGGNNPVFDFDGDGAVAASDFVQFRLRFGGSI